MIRLPLRSMLLCTVVALAATAAIAVRGENALKSIVLLEREDPLFDFPGLSPADWPEVTATIKTANGAVLAELPQRFGSFQIYPYHVWESASEVASVRRQFQNHPTLFTAWRLMRAEERAGIAYSRDLNSVLEFWRLASNESQPLLRTQPLFTFIPGRATDARTIEAVLGALQANAALIMQDLRGRRNCAYFGLCSGLTRAANRTEGSLPTAMAPVDGRQLPRGQLASSFAALGATALDTRTYALATDCFGAPGETSRFVLGTIPIGAGRMMFWPKLATDSFFRHISLNRSPPEERAYRAGFSYAWQVETFWYICPDLGYYPLLATMHEVAVESTADPLADRLAPNLTLLRADDLRALERSLSSIDPITIGVVADYIEALQTARMEFERAGAAVPPELNTRIRLWQTKSGGLSGVLAGLPLDTRTFADTAAAAERGNFPRALAVAVSRAHLSLLYAVWNPSVWRGGTTPRFLVADPESTHPLIRYQTLRKTLGEADIARIQWFSAAGLRVHGTAP